MTRGEQLRWVILIFSALNGGGTFYRMVRRVRRAWSGRNPWHLGGAILWGGVTWILLVLGRATYRLAEVPRSTLVHEYIEGLVAIFVGVVVLTIGESRGRIARPE